MRFEAHTSRARAAAARPECDRPRSARNKTARVQIPFGSIWVGGIEPGVIFGYRMSDVE